MRKDSDTKKGFTIIEVSLVIAIAGLIFLMVFVALPSLQRLTRDSQRKENIAQLMTAIKKYQTNSRGSLPTGSGSVTYTSSNVTKTTWKGFYKNYLGENFVDPSGTNYTLNVKELVEDDDSFSYTKAKMDYTIYVLIGARCDGETAIKTENPRKVALVYRLEGSGVYCDDM